MIMDCLDSPKCTGLKKWRAFLSCGQKEMCWWKKSQRDAIAGSEDGEKGL